MAELSPKVSILVPVRNGAATLHRALATIKAQTYSNLEIILSDNASDDETPAIMKAFTNDDPRARYVRHDAPLKVLNHFTRLISMATGAYSVLCAADDERNASYVAALVEVLERDRGAVLAFGRTIVVGEDKQTRELSFAFDNGSLPLWRRLSRSAWLQCFHFYGLWRTATLQQLPLRECTYWPDMQVMFAANCHGTFARNDDATFIYHEKLKSHRERALYQSYALPSLLAPTRLFSTSALAVVEAGGGVPMAAWATGNLAVREARNAALSVRRRIIARLANPAR